MNPPEFNLFEFVGGEPTFRRLVDVFYEKVEADTILRPMFPSDLEPGKHYQYLFLMQYWGGSDQYSQQRGHPRLRMRHHPYAITSAMRDRWVDHMLTTIDEIGIQEPARTLMRDYFERGATFLINTQDKRQTNT